MQLSWCHKTLDELPVATLGSTYIQTLLGWIHSADVLKAQLSKLITEFKSQI